MAERRLTNWILGFVSVTAAIAGCSREVALPLPPVQPEVSKEKETVQESSFYTFDLYDKSRDPASDLAATIQRATAENKRILLQVGDWFTMRYLAAGLAIRHWAALDIRDRHRCFWVQYRPPCSCVPDRAWAPEAWADALAQRAEKTVVPVVQSPHLSSKRCSPVR